MITTENNCEPFERFHPRRVASLSEVCGLVSEWNKSWQSATVQAFIYFSFPRRYSKANAKCNPNGIYCHYTENVLKVSAFSKLLKSSLEDLSFIGFTLVDAPASYRARKTKEKQAN